MIIHQPIIVACLFVLRKERHCPLICSAPNNSPSMMMVPQASAPKATPVTQNLMHIRTSNTFVQKKNQPTSCFVIYSATVFLCITFEVCMFLLN